MPSIRNTKKWLKREVAEGLALLDKLGASEQYSPLTMRGFYLYDTIYQSVKLKEQELENLKRKKK